MIKSQLSVMVNLASIDGEVSEKELDLIRKIGFANGFSKEEIEDIINQPEPLESLEFLRDIPSSEKFEYMYAIVLLMKADGKLMKEEINYCLKIAELLGYRESVLFEFITTIYSDPMMDTDKNVIKDKVQKYLR
ncbi:TerB family tellurite resistance protein [Fulvivirgaceae bacterium BMA10]|uniref:TerB family tellurite resistance protein n=1 Tax=Splendidivirga corallicola TaxID=3051826 RepID=A0ABT8KWA9_9BACT|nr:TerB family tellurite resistance protein [Fulvivirgaceae bacterium BMA10]